MRWTMTKTLTLWAAITLMHLCGGEWTAHAQKPGEMSWGAYFGGVGDEECTGVGLDAAGNIYVCGFTFYSPGWVSSVTPGFQVGHYDIFAARLTLDGRLAWITLMGGAQDDRPWGMAVNAAGELTVAGSTYSAGWTSGGYDTTLEGSKDGFVTRLNSAGRHLWSAYVGGAGSDSCNGIAVDSLGYVLVTGETTSYNWTQGGYDTSFNGGMNDGFAAKLNGMGQLVWSTYLGGNSYDLGAAIATDATGACYVTGSTYSTGWVSGGYDLSISPGYHDAFVVKLTAAGQHAWSTYLGGVYAEGGKKIAVDHKGDVVALGTSHYPTWVSGGYYLTANPKTDTFLAKLTKTGAHLWSCALEGYPEALAIDAYNNLYIAGIINTPAPWLVGGADLTSNGKADAYVIRLSPAGLLHWGSLLGGANDDNPNAITLDGAANLIVAGTSRSAGWLAGGFDTTYDGNLDGFVTRLRNGGPAAYNSLRVTLAPVEAVKAGAAWRIAGESDWRPGGDTVIGLAAGAQALEFKEVTGWKAPTGMIAQVQPGRMATAAASYTPHVTAVLTSPAVAAAHPGQSVTLSALATGIAPLKLQWLRNGVPIAGATHSMLTLSGLRLADAGRYTLKASNSWAAAESEPARLIVSGGGDVIGFLLGVSYETPELDINGDRMINIADALAGHQRTPPDPLSGPAPAPGATAVVRRPTLNWADCLGAKNYDVYLWPASQARPAKPVAATLTTSQWTASSTLIAMTAYKWQVVAHGYHASAITQGPVWTFTTGR